MRICVTGGGGFLGRYLVEQLTDRGDEVRVFCRGTYPGLESMGVEIVRGDLRNASDVDAALQDVEAVFHVAAVPGIWGSWQMFHGINTVGTQNVLNACRQQGVRKLIYTSSPSVVFDGQPHLNADESLPYPDKYLCHYPHSKALAEQSVLAANCESLSTVALRPHLIWGPRDNHLIPRLIHRAQCGRLIRIGDGSNEVSVSYVENTAAAHIQALEALHPGASCAGKVYFINEPQPVKLWDWANEILSLADAPPVRRSLPAGLAYGAGAMLETLYSILRLKREPPMTRFLALQLSQSHSYSTAAAERDFGFQPRVAFDEAMRRLAVDLQSSKQT